jgi:hypothetical protein
MIISRKVLTYHGPGSEVGQIEQNVWCAWVLKLMGHEFRLFSSKIRPTDLDRYRQQQTQFPSTRR